MMGSHVRPWMTMERIPSSSWLSLAKVWVLPLSSFLIVIYCQSYWIGFSICVPESSTDNGGAGRGRHSSVFSNLLWSLSAVYIVYCIYCNWALYLYIVHCTLCTVAEHSVNYILFRDCRNYICHCCPIFCGHLSFPSWGNKVFGSVLCPSLFLLWECRLLFSCGVLSSSSLRTVFSDTPLSCHVVPWVCCFANVVCRCVSRRRCGLA